MRSFGYTRATSVADALNHLTTHTGSRFIAGGTNVLDLMKEGVSRPEYLVDINKLDELRRVRDTTTGGLTIGALVTNADLAYDRRIASRYPLLSKSILAGASAQLRNMATTGGNLMQRTRCWYFYDTATPCNKRDPGSGCGALAGHNRIHAILGTSDACIATHPSDMCVALAALEASVHVDGPRGKRTIPITDFHRLPGTTPEIDTNLAADEIIVSVELPPQGYARHFEYLKIRDRQSYAFALVSVAAALELDDGRITAARLALGGVAHKPWRNPEAEKVLVGQPPEARAFAQAAAELLSGARGYADNSFKIDLARRAVMRALTDAVAHGSDHADTSDRVTGQPHRGPSKGHGASEVRP